MASLPLSSIAKIISAHWEKATDDPVITRLLMDSRQFSSAGGLLFFALRGKTRDGHEYLPELIDKGVKAFVGEQMPKDPPTDCHFLVVRNSLAALQMLARDVRLQSPARVIGITGSNGKTIVKEWLAQVLQQKYRVCRSPKSYNSQIGVPLSVWELGPHDELGIFEAGISQPGEMARLEEIIQPDIGIFTNIGSAHDENFSTVREKLMEKLKLFANCEKLVYRRNDSFLSNEIQAFGQEHKVELLSWSTTRPDADLYVKRVEEKDGKTSFQALYRDRELEISIPFTDDASIENALHCWRLALDLEVDESLIRKSFGELQVVEMRLQMKAGQQGNIIINDAYNSDLESLRIALHYLEHQAGQRQKVLIISDMLQTGIEEAKLQERISEMIKRFELDRVIAIGEQVKHLKLNGDFDHYPDTEAFLKNIYAYPFRDTAILLKGARSFHFEDISSRLEAKSHETQLKIFLNRMVGNLKYFREKLAPGTRVMAMVKAFSYGSGAVEIANLLQFHKVDYLGVAYTDEGVTLRQAGISVPIMVLNPEDSSFEDLMRHGLEPEVYSFSQLNRLLAVVRQFPKKHPLPVHIKLETGMNRLGFTEDELEDLAEVLKQEQGIRLQSVFSHLAASDDPGEEGFTRGQIRDYDRMSSFLREKLGSDFIRHICNSAGISHYPEAHFDMVRLGIGLYGVGANEEDRRHLEVVSELYASVSQIKELKAGESVSYGRKFVAAKPTQIAVVSIGYADGFSRSLSNGKGEVAIRGKRHPVLGSVCMDMIMVDVTGSDVHEGDEVEIFGPNISLYEMAEKMNTIPYEVLTSIGQRVKRVYFME